MYSGVEFNILYSARFTILTYLNLSLRELPDVTHLTSFKLTIFSS